MVSLSQKTCHRWPGAATHEDKRRLRTNSPSKSHSSQINLEMAAIMLSMKSRDITLPTKVGLVKAMVFPVAMFGSESRIVKKAEHQRTDAFEMCCWRSLLRVPWTARRSDQSILKEISPEYSLERLILKLKLQYFGHLMRRADSLEKILMLRKTEG